MAKKEVKLDVEVLKDTGVELVVRANKPLKENEFKLLSDLVKNQEDEAGLKIVVLPHSADLVDVESIKAEKEELEKLKAEVQAEREALEKAQAEAKKETVKKAKKEKEKEADK